MQSNEVLEMRLNDLDKIITMANSNFSGIYNNLLSLENCLNAMNQRLHVLEEEVRLKKIKKYIFKMLITLYPVLMAIMFFMIGVEHTDILEILNHVETWMGY